MSDLVNQALNLFGTDSKVLTYQGDTLELARDRLFRYLKQVNAGKPALERWVFLCEVLLDVIATRREPGPSWARHLLDNDASAMLAKLHKAHVGRDYRSPYDVKPIPVEEKMLEFFSEDEC